MDLWQAFSRDVLGDWCRFAATYHGQSVGIPDDAMQAPDPAALAWHNENCFKG
jgi:hypothetical protein